MRKYLSCCLDFIMTLVWPKLHINKKKLCRLRDFHGIPVNFIHWSLHWNTDAWLFIGAFPGSVTSDKKIKQAFSFLFRWFFNDTEDQEKEEGKWYPIPSGFYEGVWFHQHFISSHRPTSMGDSAHSHSGLTHHLGHRPRIDCSGAYQGSSGQ